MKYNFHLINSHIPPKKCGMDPVSALITGGVGLVGNIGSAIIGADSADDARAANISENQKNRDFQSAEADKSRQWQEAFWKEQFGAQTEEWYNQFNKQSQEWYNQQAYSNRQSYDYWLAQQDYNSLANQAKRANSAGLNASAVIGNSTFGGTGLSAAPVGASVSPNVPSPSTPSTSIPSGSSIQVAQPSNFADSFGHIVGGVSDLMKALASSRKDNADANQSEKMLSGMLQEQLLNIHNKQLVNSYQEAYNVFFSRKAPKELQQLGANVDKILAERLLTDATTDKVMNESVTETFKQLLLDNQSKLAHADFMKALIVVDNLDQQLKAEIKLRKAQANQANAAAYESTMAGQLHISQKNLADMEFNLTSLKTVFQTLENGINANKFKLSQIGLDAGEADALIKSIERAQKLEDIQNNWNLWNQVRRVKNLLGFDINLGIGVHN